MSKEMLLMDLCDWVEAREGEQLYVGNLDVLGELADFPLRRGWQKAEGNEAQA